MKRSLIALALVALSAASVQAQGFIRITTPADDEVGIANINEPVLLEGECSPDIAAVSIRYFFTPSQDLRRGADARPLELVETYRLTKYVPGSGRFLYRIYPSLGNLGCGTNQYVVVGMDAGGRELTDEVRVMSYQYFGEKAKPVIYLYTEAESDVRVSVRPREGVSVSDPPIGSGWSVIARPDGRITNKADGKDYPYLFWESPDASPPFSYRHGFVVAKADLEPFFSRTLAALGLSPAETADFIGYWLMALADHPWYHFYFFPRERIDAEAPLEVSPVPDTVLRVFFDYRGLEAPVEVEPQVLDAPARVGFVVVEWGGRKYTR